MSSDGEFVMTMKLFVRNLSYDLSDDELKDVFGDCGTVVSAVVITDRATGRSKGFGFVEMSTTEEGEEAIKKLNGQDVKGRPLSVDKARDNRPRAPR